MKKVLLPIAFLATITSIPAYADTMQHWANVRDESGSLIGTVDAYSDVQVYGICEDNPARSYIYIPETGTYGTVASVYLYGGTDYEYENPLEYSYGTYTNSEYSYADYSDYGYYPYNYGEEYNTGYDESSYDSYSYESYSVQQQDYAYEEEPVSYETPEYGTDAYWDWLDRELEETGGSAYFDTATHQWTTGYLTRKASDGEVWIDVDITNQTITAYSGDTPIVSGSCVTGIEGAYDTPTGTHYIMSKETGATLRGENPDGSLYECPVDYWMPFTDSGCGIHDATWRGAFGGDIYKSSGSYGCVNTPYDVVSEIYAIADVGTRIEVHY